MMAAAVEHDAQGGERVVVAPIRCVGRRVDHLCLAFAVELSPEVLRDLRARANLSVKRCVSFEVGEVVVMLLPCSKADRWTWESKHSHGRIDLSAPGGWTVEVTIHGERWLENPDVEAQLAWTLKIARTLGRVCEERADRGARLRRFDLCADFENFSIEDLARDSFVMPKGVHRKGSLGRYTPEFAEREYEREQRREQRPRGGGAVRRRRDSKDVPSLVRYENALQVTGHTICAGNEIMGKLYAKSVELLMPQRALKAAIEQSRWRANGWQGGPVTRVEFQIRSTALDEFKLRDPWDVLTKLDAVWQYLTQAWVRLVERRRDGERARDTMIETRWRHVNDVRFYGEAEAIKRMRTRGGASEDQALGAVLSCLAGNGRLARLAREPLRRAMSDDTSGAEQAEYLTSIVIDVCLTFAMQHVEKLLAVPKRTRVLTTAGEWIDKESFSESVTQIAEKMDAKWARFHAGPLHEDVPILYWHAKGDGEGGMHVTLQESRPGARRIEAVAAGPPAAPS